MLSENGKWDGSIGWPYSEERAKTHYYSQRPVNSGKWVFFHRKDTEFKSLSIEELKKYTFGVTLGEWAMDGDDAFTTLLRNGVLNYEQAQTDELMFVMLARGRIDVFPQQVDVGYHQIKMLQQEGRVPRQELEAITHFPQPYRKMPLYLLLSKKNDRNKMMIEKFNKGMDRLHELGRLD